MNESQAQAEEPRGRLRRDLGILALVATGVTTVIGGGINVLSVEIQHQVPGVGNWVPWIFVIGAVPAIFTALVYASLGSAMPAAGGSYVYTTRGLHPLIGFVATFSEWFGLASCCGVIAYVDVTLLKSAALYAGMEGLVGFLESDAARLGLPVAMVWIFWLINVLGVRTYGFTVILFMALMMTGGLTIMVTGLCHTPLDYAQAMSLHRPEAEPVMAVVGRYAGGQAGLAQAVTAIPILYFAYIGFSTISQAGGEAKDPRHSLPVAFVLSTTIIVAYYVIFSAAVYHAVPWQYIAVRAAESEQELSAPELLGVFMPRWLAVFVSLVVGATLADNLPPMLMSISRLFFAWTQDGIFPRALSAVNRRFATPHWALTISAGVATAIVLECHFHGFFKGVDTVVTALLFTYLMISVTLFTLPRRNPDIYNNVAFLRRGIFELVTGVLAVLTNLGMLVVQIVPDVTRVLTGKGELAKSSTFLWLVVMAIGAGIYAGMWYGQKARGQDPAAPFRSLPDESVLPAD